MAFYEELKDQLTDLPGESSHIEMFPLRARTSEALKTAQNYRVSAVLALLYNDNGIERLILIERQDYDGKHSGQIGFPGGKKEESDADELSAALRETFEEIGIAPEDVTVIGKLTDVYIPVSNFLVHPFVGYLKNVPDFRVDTREVKSVFSIDITHLLKNEFRISTNIVIGKGSMLKDVPAFCIDEKIIWGATALMLNELSVVLRRMGF